MPVDDVTFLFILGVEGVGHHGVSQLFANITGSLGYEVKFRNIPIREVIWYSNDLSLLKSRIQNNRNLSESNLL
jgi:hypothetical protein